jgi:hypothetical protein
MAAREQLEAMVTRTGRRRRWRRPGLVSVAAVTVALGATAGLTYSHFQPVTNTTTARCYTVPSTAGDEHFTTIAAAGQPGSPGRVGHARSVCASLWRHGFLSTGASGINRPPPDSTVTYPVPALVVCTMPDGTAAVLPGNAGTCGKLGLAVTSHP